MFKVGDRVRDVTGGDALGTVKDINLDGELSIHWDGEFYDPADTVHWNAGDFEPLQGGPVHTVARKEIEEGTYGPVVVGVRQITVAIDRDHLAADRLRTAAATLLEIAEALE